jgi:predicted transcriptional regulator
MILGRRGFLEIIAEILRQLEKSSLRKTAISYRCHLDSRAVSKYLQFMEKTGLVSKSKEHSSYFVISPKGIIYVKKYNDLIKPLKKIIS